MGVLIFTLAFLPKVGGRTQVLVQAEATGPVSNKLVPKTALSARILYLIYISLTLWKFSLSVWPACPSTTLWSTPSPPSAPAASLCGI